VQFVWGRYLSSVPGPTICISHQRCEVVERNEERDDGQRNRPFIISCIPRASFIINLLSRLDMVGLAWRKCFILKGRCTLSGTSF
jgi:hypothetical protein